MHGSMPLIVTLATALGLALLLGFLAVVPYLGSLLFHGLRVWIFLNTVAAVGMMLDVPFWQAVASSALGWGFVLLTSHRSFGPLRGLRDGLWRLATGFPVRHDLETLVKRFLEGEDPA